LIISLIIAAVAILFFINPMNYHGPGVQKQHILSSLLLAILIALVTICIFREFIEKHILVDICSILNTVKPPVGNTFVQFKISLYFIISIYLRLGKHLSIRSREHLIESQMNNFHVFQPPNKEHIGCSTIII